jgi:hypothetical protein
MLKLFEFLIILLVGINCQKGIIPAMLDRAKFRRLGVCSGIAFTSVNFHA